MFTQAPFAHTIRMTITPIHKFPPGYMGGHPSLASASLLSFLLTYLCLAHHSPSSLTLLIPVPVRVVPCHRRASIWRGAQAYSHVCVRLAPGAFRAHLLPQGRETEFMQDFTLLLWHKGLFRPKRHASSSWAAAEMRQTK